MAKGSPGNRPFHFQLITDRQALRLPLRTAVQAALRGGVDSLQVREKSMSALDLARLVEELLPLCARAGVDLLVNDRIDVAVACGARGVHLARKSLPPDRARVAAGPGLLIGCSVHSVEEAVEAERLGADYVTFGTVFASATHPGQPAAGVDELGRVVRSIGIPVLAIGGIDPGNVDEVLATGCSGIAVIRAVLDRDDPKSAAAALRRALDRSPHRPLLPFPGRRSGRCALPGEAAGVS